MRDQEIVVTEGLFSKLTISLSQKTLQKMLMIPKKDNPLADIEHKLKNILNEFEIAYFEYTHQRKGGDKSE